MRENGGIKQLIRNLSAVIFVGAYCLVFTLILSIIINYNNWFLDYFELAESIVNLFVFFGMLLILLHFKGYFGKFTLKSLRQGIVYSLPLVLFYAYFSVQAIKWIFFDHRSLYTPRFRMVFWIQVFYLITVGMAEELVFRCGFLNYLLGRKQEHSKKREVFACIYSALLFGGMHFMGYFTTDMGLENALYTVGFACVIGYIFAVLYLKTKNLVFVMFLHSAWDFTAYCNWKMIVEKYKYGGHYNFMHYQFPVLLVMVVIVSVLLCKSTAEELSLHPISKNGKEGEGVV